VVNDEVNRGKVFHYEGINELLQVHSWQLFYQQEEEEEEEVRLVQ